MPKKIGTVQWRKPLKIHIYTMKTEITVEFDRHRAAVERGKGHLTMNEYGQYLNIAEGKADASGRQ